MGPDGSVTRHEAGPTVSERQGLSRRTVIGASAAGAVVALLAGCDDDGESAASSTRAAAATTSTTATTAPPSTTPTTAATTSTTTNVTTTTTTPAASVPRSGPLTLFSAADMNFGALFALSAAAYGAGEVGEVVSAVDVVNSKGASYQTFFDAFMDLGARLSTAADEAQRSNRLVTARAAHRRAAQYFDQALFFVLGTSTPDREADVYQLMQNQWDASTQLETTPFERCRSRTRVAR